MILTENIHLDGGEGIRAARTSRIVDSRGRAFAQRSISLPVWSLPVGQAGSAIAIGAVAINATILSSPTSARITTEIGVGVEAVRHRGPNAQREHR